MSVFKVRSRFSSLVMFGHEVSANLVANVLNVFETHQIICERAQVRVVGLALEIMDWDQVLGLQKNFLL